MGKGVRLFALLCLTTIPVPAAAQELSGTLVGQVTDQQGASVPGATVTITNTQTNEVRTATADEAGRYRLDLPPGRYNVRFTQQGFTPVLREDVLVLLGTTFTVDARLAVGALTETVEVTATATPLVDTRSTVVTHNVTEEEFSLMPKTRTFQSVALTAPSVNSGEIEGGMQVNGASGAENAFTVDGIVTNSLINGQSRQDTVFDYLQEVQVKTTGISAQYGGALGGVVSAVTKSGGNIYHGEAHFYGEGSAFRARPVRRLVLDPLDENTAFYVQDEESPESHAEFGGSLGGPIIRDRLFFFASYSPRVEQRTNEYRFTDAVGDIERTIWRQQAFGKITASFPRLAVNGSVLWTPWRADGTLTAYDGAVPNAINRAQSGLAANIDRGYENNQVNTSLSASYSLTPTSILTARGGFFHDRYSDIGIPLVTSFTYGNSTESVAGLIPAALQGPSGFANTPRAEIADFDTTDRWTFDLDYAALFSASGTHNIQAGYGFQRTTNDINTFYPGGYVNVFWGRSFTFGGQTGTGAFGYYEVNDRRITNRAGNNIHALYVQDQWTVGSRLTLNLGLRAEDERVPTFRPDFLDTAFHFNFADKLAPRVGAAYDLTGDGRMKLFGSWGLYYDWTKYQLVRGSFGAETWCIYYRGLDTLDLGSLSLANMPGPDLWTTPGTCRDRRVPSFDQDIDPDIEPMKQASTSVGLDYQVGGNGVVSVHYVHNDLLQTIEDIGFLNAEGDEGYLIGNPGERATALQFPTGATPAGFPTPTPKRVYDALELSYNKRLADNWFFGANYTLSRLWGNYPGLSSSDEITTPTTGGSSAVPQQQAGSIFRPGGNVNRAWDLDELLWDSRGNLDVTGRLATDRPHVVKLYGGYLLPFGTNIGGFFYGASGTPISTYVTSTHSADIFVNGRGDMGRTPALYRTDMHVSHDFRLTDARRVRLEFTVLNVFNQKTARHIYNYLNKGGIIPDRSSSFIDLSGVDLSQGYDYNALILATPDGADAFDPRYGMPDLFEPGTRAYGTVKVIF
jgi:hypothetical protein